MTGFCCDPEVISYHKTLPALKRSILCSPALTLLQPGKDMPTSTCPWRGRNCGWCRPCCSNRRSRAGPSRRRAGRYVEPCTNRTSCRSSACSCRSAWWTFSRRWSSPPPPRRPPGVRVGSKIQRSHEAWGLWWSGRDHGLASLKALLKREENNIYFGFQFNSLGCKCQSVAFNSAESYGYNVTVFSKGNGLNDPCWWP